MKMKLLIFTLLLCSSRLLANVTIFSGGFEQELTTEWASTISTGLQKFERISDAHTGSWALQMIFSDAAQKGNLNTPSVIEWEKDQIYRISFWYKTEVPADNEQTNIKLFDSAGTKLTQFNVPALNSSEWKLYTVDYQSTVTDATGGYALFSFRPADNGSGNYTLDDFKIEKVEFVGSFFDSLKSQQVMSDSSVVWQQFGPGMSGNNKSAFWHPTDPNVLFIGPNMGNSYVSMDGGKTYQTILNEDESDFKRGTRGPIELTCVDFSRQDADFGMCTDERNQGIYFTVNRGEKWTALPVTTFNGIYVNSVAVDPKDDNIWYAGSGRMRNLGSNLFPNSQPKGTLYDAASQSKIWKSTDKGANWTLISNGLDSDTETETIFVDPRNSDIVYASTNTGFYVSYNGGALWQHKDAGIDNLVLKSLGKHYDPNTDLLTLYVFSVPIWKVAGTTLTDDKGGLYKSIDRGETWTKIEGNLALDMRPFSTNSSVKNSYATCACYVFGMSKEDFLAQYPDMPSKITIRFNTIEVDPTNPNNIYMNNEYSNASRNNFMPGQIWRSKDGGLTWYVTLRNGTAWRPGSSDYSYWVGRGNPMESNVHFKYLNEWFERDSYDRKGSNFVKFNADGTILHTQMAKVSFFSYDKGDSWLDIDDAYTASGVRSIVGAGNSNVPGHGFYQHPLIRNRVFCTAGENQLFVTNNEGNQIRAGAQAATSYRILSEETSASCYAVNPRDTLMHYAMFFRQAGKGKLYRSTNYGETWKEHGTAIPAWEIESYGGDQSVHQLHLTIDPVSPDNMYFVVPVNTLLFNWVGNSVTGFGVHKSSDGGQTWKEANIGLPNNPDATKIAIDPQNPANLFVSVYGPSGGLFKSSDYGESWSQVQSTIVISKTQGINDIHFARDGKVYISAGSKNGGVNDGGVWVSSDNMESWTKVFDFPFTNRIETAYYNPSVIMVSTIACNTVNGINTGTYLSKDGGENWIKINIGNGQADRVNDIAIDNHVPGKYYASTYGSGWYVGIDKQPAKPVAATGMSISPNSINMNVDEQKSANVSFTPSYAYMPEIIWTSDNSTIASINKSGIVIGKSVGTTIIRASSPDGTISAQVEVVVDAATGIADRGNQEISVFPNPVKRGTAIQITHPYTQITTQLYNLDGKLVFAGTSSTIETSALSPGLFILKLMTEGEKINYKLYIQ